MSRKVFWSIVAILIVAVGWVVLLAISVPAPTVSADAPRSESEPSEQVTVEDFKLLGCEENICVYLVDVPYGDDCILAIQYLIMDENVFSLECPRP